MNNAVNNLWPRRIAGAGVLAFALQLWLAFNALFFGRTSTAPIAILFMPLYLCIPILTAWGVASVARRVQLRRIPG